MSATCTPIPSAPARAAFTSPRSSIRRRPEGYVIDLDLPGVPREALQIDVVDRELTIRGQRADPTPDSGVLHREIRGTAYQRTFVLGADIDAARISATLTDGVLHLTLPKAPELQPRKVEIGS